MADRLVCRSCWTANEEAWEKCLGCRTPRGTEATAIAAEPSTATRQPGWWQAIPMRFAWVGVVAVMGSLAP